MTDGEDDGAIGVGDRLMALAKSSVAMVEAIEAKSPDPGGKPLRMVVVMIRGDIACTANLGYGNTSEHEAAGKLVHDLLSALKRITAPFGEMRVKFRDPQTGEEREA